MTLSHVQLSIKLLNSLVKELLAMMSFAVTLKIIKNHDIKLKIEKLKTYVEISATENLLDPADNFKSALANIDRM